MRSWSAQSGGRGNDRERPDWGAARRSGTPSGLARDTPPTRETRADLRFRPRHARSAHLGSSARGSGRPRGSAIRFALPSGAPRQAASPPSSGRPLHSPRSPCLLHLPSRPSLASFSPRASLASLAAALRARVASGLSRGRSASSPRGPPSSPAARRALTGWPAGCRRRSCSARHASGGGVAASRVGLSPSCAVWLVRVGPVPAPSPRSGCRRLGGRALGGWRRPGRRRLASRASAPGPGRLWRSRSAWASRLSCGSQRVPRRPRAGGSPSSAPGGGVPGGAPQRWPRGAATSGGAVRPGRRRRRPVHTPP